MKSITALYDLYKTETQKNKDYENLKFEHIKILDNLNKTTKELENFKEKSSYRNRRLTENTAHIEKLEKTFNIEKAQLEYQIEELKTLLSKKFSDEKPSTDSKKQPITDFEDLYKSYLSKYEKSKISYTKLQLELGKTKEKSQLLQNIVDSYLEKESALDSQVFLLKNKIDFLKSKKKTLKERIRMQNEEILCSV